MSRGAAVLAEEARAAIRENASALLAKVHAGFPLEGPVHERWIASIDRSLRAITALEQRAAEAETRITAGAR